MRFRILRALPVLSVFILVASQPRIALGTSFNITDFSSISGLNLVGDSAIVGTLLRLTPALENQVGAAWSPSLLDISLGFESTFQFQITEKGGFSPDWSLIPGSDGGDGIAFVIQAAGPSALGLFASGIGYYNIPNSLAIEFDTWQNKPSYFEPNGNHIAVQSLGTAPNRPEHHASIDPLDPFPNPNLGITRVAQDMSDGSVYSVHISYVPGNLSVFFEDPTNPLLTVAVDLSMVLDLSQGGAYLGFTSSTGGAWENHDILTWSASPIPEPNTFLLLAAGLALLPSAIRIRR